MQKSVNDVIDIFTSIYIWKICHFVMENMSRVKHSHLYKSNTEYDFFYINLFQPQPLASADDTNFDLDNS